MSDDSSGQAFRFSQKAAPSPRGSFGQEDGRRLSPAPSSADVDKHFAGEVATWLDRESDEAWQIEVPDERTDEDDHELVRNTRKAFDLDNLNRRGMAWPRDNGTLDVVVAPENIDRALRIALAIADALEERGGELSAKPGEEPAAMINGERVEFSIAEKSREMTAEECQTRKEERGEPYLLQRNRPTGKLSLSL